MRHFSEWDLEGLLGLDEAVEALWAAFVALANGEARVQARIPTDLHGLRLNTMAAALPGYCGAKVYTSFQSRFSFVTLLFSMADGRALASFESGALTKLRTAATSLLAARYLVRPESTTLAVFGTGAQARAHAAAFAHRFALRRIIVVGRSGAAAFAREIGAHTGVETAAASGEAALADADIVVTATRSPTPLFDGARLREGTTLIAVGSARAEAAEIDAASVARCARIVVESREALEHEAGDLIAARRQGIDFAPRVVELAELAAGRARGRASVEEINLFESLGSALEDVAIAALAHRKLRNAGKA